MEPPFSAQHQFCTDFDNVSPHQKVLQKLPGYPRILLSDWNRLLQFLQNEFYSPDLERISDKLWWMTKQDSSNISPLHRQLVKRRAIIITEDPKLHLVWIHDRIFLKPLPRYLTSHKFWKGWCKCNNEQSGRLYPQSGIRLPQDIFLSHTVRV
jgi:hypothetical protein